MILLQLFYNAFTYFNPRSLLGTVKNLIFDMHSEMVHSFSLVKVSLKITSEDQFEFSMNQKMIVVAVREKCPKYRVISGSYFPAFGLNTERYELYLRIQSECRKIWIRNNSVFGRFSRSRWTKDLLRNSMFLCFYFKITCQKDC